PDRNRANYEAHAAIFEAILMRDPDAAETCLRDHLDRAWAQVRETFGDV
ncbi:FCD domain-containing protein, partial [Pseudoponticoccus marisrubri]